jgi:hypothetical protein
MGWSGRWPSRSRLGGCNRSGPLDRRPQPAPLRTHKRWNAAPSQELLVIRRNHRTGEASLDPLRWGLIPHWCGASRAGASPSRPSARRDAADLLGCLPAAALHRAGGRALRVEGDQRAEGEQPYAIAMKDGKLFGIGGIWENWRDPASGEWIRIRRGIGRVTQIRSPPLALPERHRFARVRFRRSHDRRRE